MPLSENFQFGTKTIPWKVFSNLISIGSIAFIALIIIAVIFTDQIIGLLGRHISSGPQRDLTVRLTRIIMPAQLFFYWGAFLMAVQYANHRFFLPALAPLFYNMGIIACGWTLYRWCGVVGFAWGVLVGAFLGNVAVQLPGAIKVGLTFRPVFNVADEDFKKLSQMLDKPLILKDCKEHISNVTKKLSEMGAMIQNVKDTQTKIKDYCIKQELVKLATELHKLPEQAQMVASLVRDLKDKLISMGKYYSL